MKRTFFFFYFLYLVPVFILAQSGKYNIEGRIGNLNPPAKAYFYYKIGEQPVVDTCDVKDGKFYFSGVTQYPFFAQIIVDHDGKSYGTRNADVLSLYVDQGNMKVESSTYIAGAKVTGSPTNDLYREFQNSLLPIHAEGEKLQATYMNSTTDQLNSKAYTDSLDNRYAEIMKKYSKAALAFISSHPESMIGVYMLRSELTNNPGNEAAMDTFFDLSEKVRSTAPGREVSELVEKNRIVAIGQFAPDFSMKDINGKKVKLSDYKGKYLLLVFWSPECDHCLGEIPELIKNYEEFKDLGFEILGVAVETESERQRWVDVVTSRNMLWSNVSDLKFWKSEVLDTYRVFNVPQNFLLDREGKIVTKELYGKKLADTLNTILKSKN